MAFTASSREYGLFCKILSAGVGNDQKPSGTDPPVDGSFPGREPDPCSAGRYLQCDPPVFQRGLCSSDCFLPWKQHTGIFPVTAPYLYFYNQAEAPALEWDDHTWYKGWRSRCGKAYGDAGDRSCHIHGRKQYPLYPKCRTGDPAAGLFKDSKSQGNRKIPCYL